MLLTHVGHAQVNVLGSAGRQVTSELVFTGGKLPARRAYEIGMVNRLAKDADDLAKEVRDITLLALLLLRIFSWPSGGGSLPSY